MLTDNLDSYTAGSDLNGQGSWSGSTYFDVQTTTYQSSPNGCVSSQTDESGQTITKSISAQTSGTQRVYFYVSSAGQLNTDEIQLRLRESGAFKCGAKLRYLTASSNCDFQTVGSSTTTEQTGISANAWHYVDIIFDCSTDTFTIKLDGGSASASRSFHTAATNIDEVSIFTSVAAPVYFDSFSDPAAPSGPASVKSRTGVAIASNKSVDGIAIASVKSIIGVA